MTFFGTYVVGDELRRIRRLTTSTSAPTVVDWPEPILQSKIERQHGISFALQITYAGHTPQNCGHVCRFDAVQFQSGALRNDASQRNPPYVPLLHDL